MRVVFAGTAEFAVPSLQMVAAAHDVVAVVTQPDRPGSRGRPAPRPVRDAADALRLPVHAPERIRSPGTTAEILELAPDALVVAAYGQIIPAALLEGPRFGGVNVHGSVLPRWRGAAPVAAAILAGDEETGVSIMQMDAGLDTGAVYASVRTPIQATDTTPLLLTRLAVMGADLLLDVLARLERGEAAPTPQDDAAATLAPRLRRDDGLVAWPDVTAKQLDRRIRALQPWPGVSAPVGGQPVRLLSGIPLNVDSGGAQPGAITATGRDHVDVATASGLFRLESVQPPGGRPMSAAAYLRGRRDASTG